MSAVRPMDSPVLPIPLAAAHVLLRSTSRPTSAPSTPPTTVPVVRSPRVSMLWPSRAPTPAPMTRPVVPSLRRQ